MKPQAAIRNTLLADAIQEELAIFHRHMSARVTDASQQSEIAVLRIGKSLESIVDDSQDQTMAIKALTQAVVGGNERSGIAHALTNQSKTTVMYVNKMSQALSDQAEQVRHALKQTEGIRAAATRIKDISTASQLLSFNARIEATRMGNQASGFVTIANEMKELARSVEAANAAITQLTDQLTRILPDLAERSSQMQKWSGQFSEQFESQSQDVNQTTQDLLETVGQLDEAGKSRQHRLVQLTQRSLSDLQFHDPVAQMLGGLEKTMVDLEKRTHKLMMGCHCSAPDNWNPVEISHPVSVQAPGDVKLF